MIAAEHLHKQSHNYFLHYPNQHPWNAGFWEKASSSCQLSTHWAGHKQSVQVYCSQS